MHYIFYTNVDICKVGFHPLSAHFGQVGGSAEDAVKHHLLALQSNLLDLVHYSSCELVFVVSFHHLPVHSIIRICLNFETSMAFVF